MWDRALEHLEQSRAVTKHKAKFERKFLKWMEGEKRSSKGSLLPARREAGSRASSCQEFRWVWGEKNVALKGEAKPLD